MKMTEKMQAFLFSSTPRQFDRQLTESENQQKENSSPVSPLPQKTTEPYENTKPAKAIRPDLVCGEIPAALVPEVQPIHSPNHLEGLEIWASDKELRELQQNEKKPASFVKAVKCLNCGPVWEEVWVDDNPVTCRWCYCRDKGKIPRPGKVNCHEGKKQ